MKINIDLSSNYSMDFPDLGKEVRHFQPHQLSPEHTPLDDADIRDTPDSQSPPSIKTTGFAAEPQVNNFLNLLLQLLENYFNKGSQSANTPGSDPADIDGLPPVSKKGSQSANMPGGGPADIDGQSPVSQSPSVTPTSSAETSSTPTTGARNLDEAAANTHPQFKPIIRGDEAQKDAQITDQASFGRAADEVAKEYGLDPNMFRAQLQAESGAFSQGYKKAMKAEGDLGRASDNNTSIGLGQISRKFLDGREWSDGGPNNHRVGGQSVSTEQYMNSPTIQLRIAAANLGMRTEDHGNGDLKKGLLTYVSGRPTLDAQNGVYLDNINKFMQNEEMMNIGR